ADMVFPPRKEWVAKQRVTIFMTSTILVNKQLGIYATQVAQKQQAGTTTLRLATAPIAGVRQTAPPMPVSGAVP
ncbi:MAG: hypothetical protein MK097_04460, partial [Dechloromonas sp.]|nr:hypothetical protein [Dechloromonas sp.]